ncbi:MAG: MATE family efflux transporter [Myxococcales bacterium]|nr:MATE family efflux transporter [Myxococcales bacterium]
MVATPSAVPPAATLHRASLARLLALAWPIVISRSSQVVVGLCDALMVAPLGAVALAATTTGALNVMTLLILPMGVVFIVSSFSSQLFGAQDFAGARRYGFYGLAVALLAQVLSVAAIAAVPVALAQLDYDPEVRALMTDYLQVRLLSGGAAIGIEALGSYYGGLGQTRLPMAANVLAMALNVVGNWLLIGGPMGLPALGVKGAAIASALATGIAFAALLGCFLAGVGAPGGRAPSKLLLSELLRVFRFGGPSGFNWFFEMAAFSFFINVVVAGLGTTSLAAMMAVMQINQVSFMPAFGVASAGSILVGQAIGARALDAVPATVRLTLLVTAGWQGLVGLSYLAVPALLLTPFLDGSQASEGLLRIGVRMLMLSAGWQLFDATAATFAEALRAAGDTAFTLWARIAIAWLVFVPGVLVTVRVFGGGDLAAVAWVVGYLGLLAGTLALRFRNGAWRRLDLTRTQPN